MSTSLAEQLKKLKVPQTSLIGKKDKKRASLLFDPKEAATIDRETYFKIGVDGLEELIVRNTCFEYFRNNLFYITTKDFERSVHDVADNNKLNDLIRHFLLCLSPYFMLHCSYKAIEWLIYRYHIHEFNKEDILMLILPYHETNIFARTLQLLNLKENDEWVWLKSLQRPGIHLPKLTLYNHAASSPYFIRFVSKTIKMVLHKNISNANVHYNFYCTTFTGAIEHANDVNEKLITEMVPCLLRGLSSTVIDFCASTYIILAKLLGKVILTEKLLNKFIERITEFSVESLRVEAIMVLVILFQKQHHITSFGESIRKIIDKPWFVNTLLNLQKLGTNVKLVLKVIFEDCIKIGLNEEENEARQICMQLLQKLVYDKECISFLISTILSCYDPKNQHAEEVEVWIKDFMHKMEVSYPSQYDDEIILILKNSNGNCTKKKKRLKHLIEKSLTVSGHYDLFEKLYHPDVTVRKKAMKYVVKEFERANEREKQFLKTSIIQHLQDNDSDIVYSTLKISARVLTSIIDGEELVNYLLENLVKCLKNENWFKVTEPILELLCSITNGNDINTFIQILPFLLPTNEKDVKLLHIILKSPYATDNFFLKQLSKNLINEENYENAFKEIYKCLNLNNDFYDSKELLSILTRTPSNESAVHKYVGAILLCNQTDSNSATLDVLIKYLQTSKVKIVKEESPIAYVETAKKNKLPLQGFLMLIEKLIDKAEIVTLSNLDLCNENDQNKFYLSLMSTLLSCTNEKHLRYYDSTKQKFLNHFARDLPSKINIYLNMCTTNNNFVSSEFRLKCLQVVENELDINTITQLKSCMDFNNLFIPYLLACTLHSETQIRERAINCLELTRKIERAPYETLRENFLKYKEEVLMDFEQVPLIFQNIFGFNDKCFKALMDCIVDDNPICLRAALVKLFSKLSDLNITETMSFWANKVLDKAQFSKEEAQIVYYSIKTYDDTAQRLQINSNLWKLLTGSLAKSKNFLEFDDVKKTPAQVVLENANANFFAMLNEPLKKEWLSLIVDIGTHANNPEVISEMNHFVKKIDLDTKWLADHLKRMKDVKSPKITSIRRRISVIPTPDILDTEEWKKGVTVLEMLQDKKKVRYSGVVLNLFFDLLKKCLDFDEQSSVEYPKQLLLSTILQCCEKLNGDELLESRFDVALIVQCIRASQNPQTHHHALLVLARTAAINPKEVLHHITTIFTFMGSSVLRHDDAYSLQIITRIIDTIIPILTEDTSINNTINVLRVFVDIILDVPEHRRIPMYKNLLTRLNVNKNLHLFLLLMFEAHVTKPDKRNDEELPKRITICTDLCKEFSPSTVIENCVKLMQYVQKLPEDKPELNETDDLIFDMNKKTPKQFRHYKYTIITFNSTMLSLNEFVNSIAEMSEDNLIEMENLYKDMIIKTLTFIQITSKVAQKNSNTNQAQYWKVMLHYSYDILDSVNALLTPKMFLLVIKGLMVHSLTTVKRRSMELLNAKLQHNESFFDECDVNELYAILPSFINIIKTIEDESLDSEQELIVQTALLSLKLLGRSLSASNPEKFGNVLNFLTDLVKKSNGNVLASLILCIAELCYCMKAHAIQSLGKFMPCVIKVLRIHKHKEISNLLLLSGLTALSKIFDSLPLFLSPYLEKILNELTSLSCKFNLETDDPKVQPIITKIVSIKQKIGHLIPLRVLIPILTNVYNRKVEDEPNAIGALTEILTESVEAIDRVDLQNNLMELNGFYLNAMNFRVIAKTIDDANIVEDKIIDSFISYILKLSETVFKPIYYKIYDWAIRGDEANERNVRIITFYHLSSKMAQRLKGLFVNFAGYFILNAANVLDACNKIKNDKLYFDDNENNILLLEYVLSTLMYIFMYDSQKFTNKERFGVLMQPIVDQLENELEDVDDLEERVKNLITPCLVQFSVAIGNDALWKQSNYQILLKMRHSNPKIRIIALKCLTEIARKLGDDFLPLLPETIPFLAELLEDEEENVEKSCQKAVQELEKILGEPLQKYF